MTPNEEIYTLKMTRADMIRLLTACHSVQFGMEDEVKNDPSLEYYKRSSIQMWKRIADEVEKQFDAQDEERGIK